MDNKIHRGEIIEIQRPSDYLNNDKLLTQNIM